MIRAGRLRKSIGLGFIEGDIAGDVERDVHFNSIHPLSDASLACYDFAMSALAELIPEAKSLSRVDKLRLIQLLADDLVSGDSGDIKPNQSYAVWSPDSAFTAAAVMLKALASEAHS